MGRTAVEMYYRLREEKQSPRRVGLSVALGVFVGCQPLYGLHLVLCFGLARLFRLSGATAYLAAYLNNPWTAPFLLFAEANLGRRLARGEWLRLDLDQLRQAGIAEIGGDLLLGSLVLGLVLALVLGGIAFLIAARWPRWPARQPWIDHVSRNYRGLGLRTWETVRGKLRHDPVYLELVRSDHWPPAGRLTDLGCGRGLLLASIAGARELAREGGWPQDWHVPPEDLELIGLEVRPDRAREASEALGGRASVEVADLGNSPIPSSDVIALVDVLHYLDRGVQEDLIRRVASALRPGGSVWIREADAAGGWRFAATRAQERLCAWARFEFARPFAYRTAGEWAGLLARHGLEPSLRPMADGTPFSNVLVVGRRPPGPARPQE